MTEKIQITFRSTSDPREVRQFITSNPRWTPDRCAQVIVNAEKVGRISVDIRPYRPTYPTRCPYCGVKSGMSEVEHSSVTCPTCAQHLLEDMAAYYK